MKLAMYYPWIYLRSGIERTIVELIKRSRHSWTVFTHHYNPKQTFLELQNLKVIELPPIAVKRDYLSVSRAAIRIINENLNLNDYRGLLIHSEGLGNLITFHNHKIPIVCYCYTPLKILHDPAVRIAYMKSHPFKKPLFATAGFIFNFLDRLSWRYYKHIFCCSNEVKQRIQRANLASSSKIEILPLGVDTQKWTPTGKQGEYFLVPSRIKWWKNIELSIYSFRDFVYSFPDTKKRLVISGQMVAGCERYLAQLKKLARGLPIQFILNPSEEEFQHLIQNSYAVLNTTLNEDGGIIVIEAMSSGKPVIAVNRGGPKEIITDKKSGFLVEPRPKSFTQAMTQLSEDDTYAFKIGKLARQIAKKYDWSNFTNRIDDCFEEIIK